MPKVIVYVPVAAWRKLEARGLDPAQAVREFARRGYELTEPGLTEGVRLEASDRLGGARQGSRDDGTKPPDRAPSVSADAQPRDIPARTVEFPVERTRGGPDPKPGQK